MSKIKVEIDKPDLPLETVRKHKNFNRFMDGYQKFHTQAGIREMWYKDKRLLSWIAILACLLLIGLFAAIDEEEDEAEKSKIESTK